MNLIHMRSRFLAGCDPQARVAAHEIAIGEVQTCDRPAEAHWTGLHNVEAGLKQRSTQPDTDRVRGEPDGPGGERDVADRSAARLYGTDHRAVGINPPSAVGAVEAGVGEQLVGNEALRLFRFKLRG